MTVEQLYEQAKAMNVEKYAIEVSDGYYFQRLKARHINIVQNSRGHGSDVPEGIIRISTV